MSLSTWNITSALAPLDEASSSPTRHVKLRVSKRDIADLTAQLAIMTRSGVDVASALKSLALQCQRPVLQEVLEGVHEDVVSGVSLSNALRRRPGVFNEAYIATVASGEASGKMSLVLDQLAELQRSELRLERTVRGMMIYPTLLASVSLLVVCALVAFVLPQFAELFEQYETPLPVLTRTLLALSDEMWARWWLWGPLVLAGSVGLVTLGRSERGRLYCDEAALRIAVLKQVVQTLLVARLCRLMGLMIVSGVPLLQALGIVQRTTKNTLFQDLLKQLEEDVINGLGIGATLQKSDIFPAAASEMIGAAEQTGKLGEVLRMVGVYFEEEGETKARQALATLEPIITVVMGAVVAVVVLAVMLPVFDLATFTQGGH